MGSRVRTAGAAAALAAVLPLSGCGGAAEERPVADVSVHDDDGLHGVVLDEPYRLPAVSLRDTSGAAYSLTRDTTRPLTLVFFGYTNCPDVCGVVLANVAAALNRLEATERDQVGMLFVTTDPARDDPATLRRYLDRFDPAFEGLTGPLPRIEAVGKALGVAITKGDKLASGGYEVGHGTQLLGVTAQDRAPLLWTAGTSSAELAADVRRVLDNGVPATGASGAAAEQGGRAS